MIITRLENPVRKGKNEEMVVASLGFSQFLMTFQSVLLCLAFFGYDDFLILRGCLILKLQKGGSLQSCSFIFEICRRQNVNS